MAGVVPALEACHGADAFGEQIDDFALAFVAPLSPKNYYRLAHVNGPESNLSKSIFLNKYPQRDHADQNHHAADHAQLTRLELAHLIRHPLPQIRRGEQKQSF